MMDLNSAIHKHAEWKTRLRSAISRQETLDADTIRKDNCCELGKWLYGEAKSVHGHLASYNETVNRHAAFHVEAGKIARKINAKAYVEAESMLGGSAPYGTASSAVGVAIMRLKKEAAL